MRYLNLGILAHVDAGKTTLTEQLLYAAGVIDEIGSVDKGSTQTDTLALERQRGITIKAAVVSFVVDDVAVNLIDTPGHPDFIAEVERVLNVLDGAVLVISAVEGVQPQTRILMRTLQRLHIPTLIFVNKIDRRGARDESVLDEIRRRLTPSIIAMGSVQELGTRSAEFVPRPAAEPAFTAEIAELLAEHDEDFLAAYLDDGTSPGSYRLLRAELASTSKRARAHPVFFGSAITGAGVEALAAAILEFLPALEGDPDAPLSGSVFKIERGAAGEKVAYVRLFSGTIRVRDRLNLDANGGRKTNGARKVNDGRKVTGIEVFDRGASVQSASARAGQIAKIRGLGDARIGDPLGDRRGTSGDHYFVPPTLETVVVPRRPDDKGALYAALALLAEQDPLINLRQDDVRQELHVALYGDVQKEVIQSTLAADFELDADFRASTAICVERPVGIGSAVEVMGQRANPFLATVGLRIEPAPTNAGVAFQPADAVRGAMPLAFFKAVEDTVRETLSQGLRGW